MTIAHFGRTEAADTAGGDHGNDLNQKWVPPVVLVNRFGPPDAAPTAGAVWSLARALAAELPERARITVVSTDTTYGRPPGTAPTRSAVHAPPLDDRRGPGVDRLPSLGVGPWLPLRLLTALSDGWALSRRAARLAGAKGVIITLSDPPLLPLWLGPGRRAGARRLDWLMDLYPEALAAAGLLSPRSPVVRLLERWRNTALPAAVIGLGPGQLDFFRARTGFAGPGFLLPAGVIDGAPPPCPPLGSQALSGPLPTSSGPVLVYAGTLGRMHRPELVAEVIERAVRRGCRALLAVHGCHARALRRRLAPLLTGPEPAVEWRNWLSDAELAAATVHLVSLAGAATHVCVPSKAVTAVCLGRPLLFAGSPASDVWTGLGAAGWLIPERADGSYDGAAIEAALDGILSPAAVAERTAAAITLGHHLRDQWRRGVRDLAAWVVET